MCLCLCVSVFLYSCMSGCVRLCMSVYVCVRLCTCNGDGASVRWGNKAEHNRVCQHLSLRSDRLGVIYIDR